MAIETLTLSEIRCLCQDESWRSQWIAGQKPETRGFDGDPLIQSLGETFSRLVAQFTYWLTASSRGKEAPEQLHERWDLWQVLFDRFAVHHIRNMLAHNDQQAAYFLACALKAYCQKLEALRQQIAPGIGWTQLYVTHAFALDAVPLPVGEAQIAVSGSVDAVRNIGSGIMEIVDYKLGRGDQKQIDSVQLAVFAKMMQIARPHVEFKGVLEYYQPELAQTEFSYKTLLEIYDSQVVPLLADVFKAPSQDHRQKNPAAPLGAAGEELRKCFAGLNLNVEITDIQIAAQVVRYLIRPESDHNMAAIGEQVESIKKLFYLDRFPLIQPMDTEVAIDIPKAQIQSVYWRDLMDSDRLLRDNPLAVVLGKGIDGNLLTADLNESATAHFLLAGDHGSGKSEFLKSAVASLIVESHPRHITLSLVDTTRRTFKSLVGSNFLRNPVLTEVREIIDCLQAAVKEMDRRLTLLSEEGRADLKQRHDAGQGEIPYWVIVFDEFEHLMLAGSKEKQLFEQLVFRLAGKGREAGMHLLLATRRPDARIITGPLKSVLPLKMCFRVPSEDASKLVLDQAGGERLLGQGDFLCDRAQGIERAQAAIVRPQELVNLAHLMI